MTIQICTGKNMGKWQKYVVRYLQFPLAYISYLVQKVALGFHWFVIQGSVDTHTCTAVTYIIIIIIK